MTSDAVTFRDVLPPADRAAPRSLVEQCAAEALETADQVIGEYDPSRMDPAHDDLRVACFTVVLSRLLAAAQT
jgi:hypothetical protein